MLGIILCGGESSRMGCDKGLIKRGVKTWAQLAIDKVAALNLPVKISVNHQQMEDYSAVFAKNDLIQDNSHLQLKGPLLGLLSCHLQYPTDDLLVLACDMPLMESFLLKELYKQYRDHSFADAFVFTNDGEPEPLCGIYTARGLSAILSLLNQGKLSRDSMKCLLSHLEIKTTSIREDQQKYFRNFNDHAGLNGL